MPSGAEAITGRIRPGGRALLMLSDALNASILRALLHGPLPVSELVNRLRPMSRTTRFSRLRGLEQLGVIARVRLPGTPPVTYCSLSPSGQGLLLVVGQFAKWLAAAPERPSSPDDVIGARTIKALATAWESTVLRWLAERPCSLNELNALSPGEVTYHEVRKVRELLSATDLIAPAPSDNCGQPYALTDWARGSAGCIAAAIHWERTFLDDTRPPSPTEVETLLLLLLPLVEVPLSLCGGEACSLQIDGHVDLSVAMEKGRVVTHELSKFNDAKKSRLSGPAESWFDTLTEGHRDFLRAQGRVHLTTALANGLHKVSKRFSITQSKGSANCNVHRFATRENRTVPISSDFMQTM